MNFQIYSQPTLMGRDGFAIHKIKVNTTNHLALLLLLFRALRNGAKTGCTRLGNAIRIPLKTIC